MPTTQGRPEQMQAFLERKPDGALLMLNLYKFKDKAEYPDGRETQLSGAEAYALFADGVVQLLEARGGRVAFAGATHALIIGDGELAWDALVILEHASFEAFVALTQSPDYAALSVHRDAGLAHQVLINCLSGDEVPVAFGASRRP